jgi:hypothetical protein
VYAIKAPEELAEELSGKLAEDFSDQFGNL